MSHPIFTLPKFIYGREVVITIPGKAVAKQSTNFRSVGDFVMTYTDKHVAEYANLVRLAAMQMMQGQRLLEGAIEATMRIHVQVQKSISKKERELRLSGQHLPVVKPDNDNCEKQMFDACQGIVYAADQAIALNRTLKMYAEIPKVEIGFREILWLDFKSNT
jgi:Holliday junction resolvase RusA-like endonuclease